MDVEVRSMKELLSVLLIFIFGIVFSFIFINRAEEVDKANLAQNYTINNQISNN